MATNLREKRGLEIAATRRIERHGEAWRVPSMSGRGIYQVRLGEAPRCECPDFELTAKPCKHIYAAQFVAKREAYEMTGNGDGTENSTASLPSPFPELEEEPTKRPTYAQNWPAYNAAQTNEKLLFQVLLADLCQGVQQPGYSYGRPKLPLRDMTFSVVFKTYSTFSGRRFHTDLSEAHDKGFIDRLPHFNSVLGYLEEPAMEAILLAMIERSSLPLKSVETEFATDSSGFSTSTFGRWFTAKYGREIDFHEWLKCHLTCGVKTNIVTAVKITGRNCNDSPEFPALVRQTAKHFTINEMSADKQYSSKANLEVAASFGAVPYIPFKIDADGENQGSVLWEKMFHFYGFHREVFLSHYHKRSNSESTFWMVKSKFGEKIRSKGEVAQKNEVLCKVLAHNVCVVIQSIFELGIDPGFCTDSALSLLK